MLKCFALLPIKPGITNEKFHNDAKKFVGEGSAAFLAEENRVIWS